MFFAYGEAELACLRARDKRLCEVIDKIGHVDRVVDTDLFSAVVHHIIGQQISTKAQATIWQRMQDALGAVNAETILAAGVPKLQALGMTFRKAEYITDFAERVHSGAFDPEGIRQKSDEEAIRDMAGKIDAEAERRKLTDELAYQEGFLASVMKKLSNERFVQSAPGKVVANERAKQADAEAKIAAIKAQLEALS